MWWYKIVYHWFSPHKSKRKIIQHQSDKRKIELSNYRKRSHKMCVFVQKLPRRISPDVWATSKKSRSGFGRLFGRTLWAMTALTLACPDTSKAQRPSTYISQLTGKALPIVRVDSVDFSASRAERALWPEKSAPIQIIMSGRIAP